MKYSDFLKDKTATIILMILSIPVVEILLLMYRAPVYIELAIPIVYILAYLLGVTIEYSLKKSFYDQLFSTIEELDKKHLLSEIISDAGFTEGRILKEILEETGRSMHGHIAEYKYLQEEYKEYIELWIHEIKLPISVSKMIVENNKNDVTLRINDEIEKIENYTEQALFYARSNTVEKDYYIKGISLKEIVFDSIKKNKRALLSEKFQIAIEDKRLDKTVYTDKKWSVFILNQIIINSIKYSSEIMYTKKSSSNKLALSSDVNGGKNIDENGSSSAQESRFRKIIFDAVEEKDNIVLTIKDNGIGISKSEISKVFDKGFTGTNGRLNGKKSTGIGLYLCKKLCDKIGLGISIESVDGESTTVSLVFPKSSYIQRI
ncbi:MAG: sensor histidine kinase [Clostridioides sp.]|jgi:signal transduction histidine kinase|nr:sensor histidine kinase [Clostridioides sp.]